MSKLQGLNQLSQMRALSLVACLFVPMLFCVGCDEDASNYRLVQPPRPETPIVNLPVQLRQKNWLGGPAGDEGSCVHASLTSHFRWQNQLELADKWRSTYSGGEYSDRLRRRLDAINVKYAFTEAGNIGFFDFAHDTGRGCICWWKPSHCCTFVGWCTDGRGVYAAILDNNYPSKYEYVPREQFHRLWAGYGGFALATLFDPISPVPFPSYVHR